MNILGISAYYHDSAAALVIMAVLFFGLIAPIAIVFRIMGRDSMHRAYDGAATSYWTDVRPSRGKESYFKQY